MAVAGDYRERDRPAKNGNDMFAPLMFAAATVAAPAPTPVAAFDIPIDEKPIHCDNCAAWNAPRAPFKLFGHSYYVGVDGLSSVLIDTGNGLILLDGGLPQSAAVIAENIRALGFDVDDVQWIALSHPHYDHVGGVAALARISGAKVAASTGAMEALHSGAATAADPQYGYGYETRFPPIASVEAIGNGDSINLGTITLTAHHTPGHTPGGASWTWRDCEGDRCIDLVFADSLNPVSHDDFKFTADGGARVAEFRHSIALVGDLPCDLLVSAHPSFSRLFERQSTGKLIDADACKAYAQDAAQRLDLREKAESAGGNGVSLRDASR